MKKLLTIIAMLFISGFVFGQSDEILDKLYEMETAQTSYASLVVLQAAGHLTLDATVDDAMSYLEGQKWGQSILKDGEEITTGSFSLLVMEAFDLPHGLIYNLLPIKRYALKEMVYNGYILGNPYPNDRISSFDVIYVLASIPVNEDINRNYVDPEPEPELEEVMEETTVEIESVEVDSAEVEPVEVSESETVITEEVVTPEVVEPEPVVIEEAETTVLEEVSEIEAPVEVVSEPTAPVIEAEVPATEEVVVP